MLLKKTFLSLLIVILTCFVMACFPQVEVSGEIENMTKEDFSEITEEVQKIEVYNHKKRKVCTFDSDKEISETTNILTDIHPISGDVETEGNSWFLLMYNENNELICYITLWRRGFLGFGEKVEKEYVLDVEHINSLEALFE